MSKFQKTEYYEALGVPALKPLLAEWIAVQREYTLRTADYSPYYRERASTGFLAAAAWQAGGVALEEWTTAKGPRTNPRKGRCDLRIHWRKQSYYMEAKHIWSRAAAGPDRVVHDIQRELDRAVADAKLLQCRRQDKFGILFIAPFYVGKQTNMSSRITTWLQGIYQIRHDAIAWLFPDTRKFKPYGTWVLPGIVLMVRSVAKRA